MKADATVAHASRGFDAGKRINGRKRHLLTDMLGLLLKVLVTPASTTDRDAARTLLPAAKMNFWRLAQVWADGGYTGHLTGPPGGWSACADDGAASQDGAEWRSAHVVHGGAACVRALAVGEIPGDARSEPFRSRRAHGRSSSPNSRSGCPCLAYTPPGPPLLPRRPRGRQKGVGQGATRVPTRPSALHRGSSGKIRPASSPAGTVRRSPSTVKRSRS
ncbi:transposase [Streptomyces sp. NPDC051098]|uniref:transposase n=1 Tax=Streptomyces sp. NPDC051098 TaxID=3155411 RepID=UPI003417EB20